MTPGRRGGAPRLIDWTGERCVPWAPDVQVIYEHFHRYLWAAELVGGRRVLDLASGEGFGASILSRRAAEVVGIDIDRRTVDHSSLNYGSSSIRFQVGDAADLSAFEDGSFGAVVAFEMIEHVGDQAQVLSEIARVLDEDGLLIVSTPDRRAYSEAENRTNPFHVKELDLEEFRTLLLARFDHIALWGQRTVTGSAIASQDDSQTIVDRASSFFVEPMGDEWAVVDGMSPLYMVGVASRRPLPPIPAQSTLADPAIRLVREAERRSEERLGEARRIADEQIQIAQAQADEQARQAEERSTEVERVRAAEHRAWSAVGDREAELAVRKRRLDELEAERAHLAARLAATEQIAAAMQYSITWKAYRRLRDRIFAALGGRDALGVRLIQASIRGAARWRRARHAASAPAPHAWPTIEFPEFDQPRVSLVIPLYSGPELTAACLRSIADRISGIPYEVIIVDDAADPGTKALLAQVRGARIFTNEVNQGYLRSVNLGAGQARGDWILLCNNDIRILDDAVEALVERGESADDIGIVTPKYLYLDGRLNEAGGIIWNDATGMNYGRGEEPSLFHYEFAREVDYGSAAALLVDAALWCELDGFDDLFLPMYYEDTDLCFRARERGRRVIYEPRAHVVHVEGGTAGTDISVGHKRNQELNRVKFLARWGAQLAHQPRPGTKNLRRAANRARGPRVLIIDHRVPMWDRDSGSLRLKGIIDALQDLGCLITLLPDNLHAATPYTAELEAQGVEVWHSNVQPARELMTLGPELALVIACRPHTASRWLDITRELAPSAAVVYDTVDLHWLREARRHDAAPVPTVRHGSKAAALREIELGLIRACDASLVVTAAEAELIDADVPGAPVFVVPNVHAIRADVPPPSEREGIIFVGGFEHQPNVDAAVRLVRNVMPEVWHRLGPVPVTIVGGSAPPEVLELASGQVELTGWVPELEPLLDRARVLVAPLSWGAGLKGKVTQALAVGLPVVTTTIGAEGLDPRGDEQLLVSDVDGRLAELVIDVLSDDDLWLRQSQTGQSLVDRICSPGQVRHTLAQILSAADTLRSREAGRPL